MLERVRLTDFKSFVDEEVELAPLTLLVGANASGKSNFLDALRFLQQIAFDREFADVLNGEQSRPEEWPGIRGKAAEAARFGTTTFAVESTWTAPIGGDGDSDAPWPTDKSELVELTHRIACTTLPDVKLAAESLGRDRSEGNLFKTGAVTDDGIEVPWPSIGRRSKKLKSATTYVSRDQILAWTILGSITNSSPETPPAVVDYTMALTTALYRLQFVDVEPARMRGYGRRRAPLGEDGHNISGVLAELCNDPQEKRTLVDWLAEICAPELVDLDFIEVPELGELSVVDERALGLAADDLLDALKRARRRDQREIGQLELSGADHLLDELPVVGVIGREPLALAPREVPRRLADEEVLLSAGAGHRDLAEDVELVPLFQPEEGREREDPVVRLLGLHEAVGSGSRGVELGLRPGPPVLFGGEGDEFVDVGLGLGRAPDPVLFEDQDADGSAVCRGVLRSRHGHRGQAESEESETDDCAHRDLLTIWDEARGQDMQSPSKYRNDEAALRAP